MAGVSVPVHAPVIDWIVQNIHEDQVAPDVLDQLREASRVCAEAVVLAGSDGPLESAGVVESADSPGAEGST